jgi:hypothetical protein
VARLSGRDRDSRFFLRQQLQEQSPLDVIFGQSELPSEDFEVFVVHEFFHGVLFSGSLVRVGDFRSWPASQIDVRGILELYVMRAL